MKDTELIQEYIIRDMSEGVMAVGFDGKITFLNPAAEEILACKAADLVGQPFAAAFFEYDENDAFNQAILNAVYDRDHSHESIVDYYTGNVTKQLHVTTSFLRNHEETVGIVCVLDDVSELNELRDALRAMERIKAINDQLELRNKLLSETFGRYLSDEIVRQLLETPDGLELGGKKRTITVIMSDLRGFTAMSERMEAQALLEMLNHYLGEMTDIIESYDGTIIEFIGDGILAIFGAPLPNEKHAEKAVAAALAMQAHMQEINLWNREHGYPELQMGIGINSGEIIVGNIGSNTRTKYGVVGSHVNLAGRIESYSVGGQVLISPATRNLISVPLEILTQQTVMPKGVENALTLSHIIGIGAPYHLHYQAEDEELLPLDKSVSAAFRCIHEKHVDTLPSIGKIISLGHTGALLETDAVLEEYLNLELDIGGKLLAKVVRCLGDGRYLLRFTSLPVCFDSWYEMAFL